MSEEEALNLVMKNEEIIKQFAYLVDNGLDLRKCFMNWMGSFKEKEHNQDGEER